ncbi:MAG: AbgT family transporter [Burkholderiales bacterium]|nr:AbgT family transporter [Burkholderiales bacterium]
MEHHSVRSTKTGMDKVLDIVERVGNKVPHPAVIFVILIGIVIVLSHILYLAGAKVTYQFVNPDTHKIETTTTMARSLLTVEGIRFMFVGVVQNFMNFQAVGVIIVAMVGVGVAEASGLVNALIRKLVVVSPPWALTYILVCVGIVSSLAADAGYLVLIPLAGAAFISVGRHPLAGLAAAFAAVAGVFLVNVFIVPIDGILVGITNDAIHIVDPNKNVSLTSNFWFSAASVVIMTIVVALITDKIVEPHLGKYTGDEVAESAEMTAEETRGLSFAFWGLVGVVAFLALLTAPEGAPLRNPTTGAIIGNSPFMNSLIVSIALLFFATGTAYGIGAGTIKNTNDVVNAMIKAIQGLGGLIFLLLIISQFLAYFNYTNMTTLAALSLADLLKQMNLDALWLLLGFVVVVMLLDLIITGAVPKWALFAPVFVPLLMRLNVPPDAVLAAYRVGDSPMNAITPLNAYFAMIVVFCQKYEKDAGVGTVVALMLPYVGIIAGVWIVLLAIWQILGLPWGVG